MGWLKRDIHFSRCVFLPQQTFSGYTSMILGSRGFKPTISMRNCSSVSMAASSLDLGHANEPASRRLYNNRYPMPSYPNIRIRRRRIHTPVQTYRSWTSAVAPDNGRRHVDLQKRFQASHERFRNHPGVYHQRSRVFRDRLSVQNRGISGPVLIIKTKQSDAASGIYQRPCARTPSRMRLKAFTAPEAVQDSPGSP